MSGAPVFVEQHGRGQKSSVMPRHRPCERTDERPPRPRRGDAASSALLVPVRWPHSLPACSSLGNTATRFSLFYFFNPVTHTKKKKPSLQDSVAWIKKKKVPQAGVVSFILFPRTEHERPFNLQTPPRPPPTPSTLAVQLLRWCLVTFQLVSASNARGSDNKGGRRYSRQSAARRPNVTFKA